MLRPGALCLLLLAGCATYRDELARGQSAYDANKHELALGILRNLELDQSHFDANERARYAYLRGMSDYRIGYRADARHWLALARELGAHGGATLPREWNARIESTLKELDELVYKGGVAALEKPIEPPKKQDKPLDEAQ